jgi:GDP-mannose 4,6-dehydratase
MKVLITGITGFVGSHLADFILASHPEVDIYGLARWRSPMDNLKHIPPEKINIIYGDLNDLGSLIRILKEIDPTYIFHLAAQSYVLTSFNAPVDTLQTNIIGTANLLEAIRITEIDPIIHVCSSSECYGQVRKEDVPITEDCPFRPASPYAVGKVGEDMLALQYWLSYGIKTIRSRMFSHEGARRGSPFCLSNFAMQIAMIEKGLQPPIVKVGNLDSVRTWADVRDAVRTYWLLVTKCPAGEVYNIGGVETMTIREMLNKLLGMSTVKGIKIEVDPTRLRPSDVTLQIPCIDKFVKATGWKPEIKFGKTILDTLNFWRDYYK